MRTPEWKDPQAPKAPKALQAAAQVPAETAASTAQEAVAVATVLTETEPRLQFYELQYNKLPQEMRSRCDWRAIRNKLLDNDEAYLKIVEAMHGGGILYAISTKLNNPLFADNCDIPLMLGLSHEETIREVYGDEHSQSGYSMFPCSGCDPTEKSEQKMFEEAKGKPFVQFPYTVWLDDDTQGAPVFTSGNDTVCLSGILGQQGHEGDGDPKRGVIRRLVVMLNKPLKKKKAINPGNTDKC